MEEKNLLLVTPEITVALIVQEMVNVKLLVTLILCAMKKFQEQVIVMLIVIM